MAAMLENRAEPRKNHPPVTAGAPLATAGGSRLDSAIIEALPLQMNGSRSSANAVFGGFSAT
jgi:hypothetical protein